MYGEMVYEPENRRFKRFDFLSRIEYVVDSPVSKEIHKGVAVNISENGMAAYVNTPHDQGQRIIIRSALPIEARIATVRWIQREDEHIYLTGLHFSDHSDTI